MENRVQKSEQEEIPFFGGKKRYRAFSDHLKELFGEKVYRVTLDAGFTCPNRDGLLTYGGCTFCDERGSGPRAYDATVAIREQLQQGMEAMRRRYKAQKFIAYFQAFTNTYAPPEVLDKIYSQVTDHEDVVGISVGTRPDCVPEPVLDVLEKYAERFYFWVEYGIQSAHFKTLKMINRAHGLSHFIDAVLRTKKRKGIRICIHVILGLPGESREEMMETAKIIAALGLDGIKIHLLHILKGTAMAKQYARGELRVLELEEYVDLVCEFLEYLPPQMLIHRLTGEGPRDIHIAPDWALDKARVLARIDQELERRQTYQGAKYGFSVDLQGVPPPSPYPSTSPDKFIDREPGL